MFLRRDPIGSPAILLILLCCCSCSSVHTLRERPSAQDIATINERVKDRWVSVALTDGTTYAGSHFVMSASDVQLRTGGSEFFNNDGDADMTIPIDAVASISVHHLNPFKPLLYPLVGALLGLVAIASFSGGDGTVLLVGSIIGAGLGALYAAYDLLLVVLPDMFTDRPRFNFMYQRQKLPIVVVDSTGH